MSKRFAVLCAVAMPIVAAPAVAQSTTADTTQAEAAGNADGVDDVIVTGGAKVQPADVEAVIEAHPAVRSAVAVPRDDDDLGQRVHAVVDIADAEVSEADLAEWVRDRLDPEKRPRSWTLTRTELRDDTGKVRRSTHR